MNEQPTHLDLFSGIGGFALAAGWAGFKTIGFCEIDPYCQAVLKKHWPQTPIHSDIKELRGGGKPYRNCTLLTGGFPCQPFSVAGKQRGKGDDRYLWPEMLRVIREARPAWIIGENVAGIVNMALDQVHTDLEAEGYEVESLIIPACGVDAPHRRDRVWIIANRKCLGQSARSGKKIQPKKQITKRQKSKHLCSRVPLPWNVADAAFGENGRVQLGQFQTNTSSDCYGQKSPACWVTEPRIRRVLDGVPNRSHRLKGLGNAIVPQVAYQIIKGIRELL